MKEKKIKHTKLEQETAYTSMTDVDIKQEGLFNLLYSIKFQN